MSAPRSANADRASAGAGDGAADRLVRSLSTAVFLQWVGASAILPMLPVYLRRHGSSDALVGAVMAAFFVAGVVVQYPAGRIADRVGRRPVLIAGLVVYALGSVAFLLPTGPYGDLVFRALQGAGGGAAEVAALAMVADAVPVERRGRATATVYGAVVAGLAVGPLLGSIAGESHMAALFIGAAAASLIACAPVLRAPTVRAGPPASPTGDTATVPAPAHGQHGGLRAVIGGGSHGPIRRAVVGALVAAAVAGLASGIYETCWTLLLQHRHAADWQIGLSWTLFAVPFVTMARPGGWLADHLDRRWLVVGALAGAAGLCAAYPFVDSLPAILVLGTFEAATWAIAYPSSQSLLSEDVAPEHLGQAQGLFATSQTGAMAVAAAAGGALFGVAPWLPFVAAGVAGGALIATLPFIWAPVHGRVRAQAGSAEPLVGVAAGPSAPS